MSADHSAYKFYTEIVHERAFMGVRAKPFGNDEQKHCISLRLLYKDKMYPLDVQAGFHTNAGGVGIENLPVVDIICING